MLVNSDVHVVTHNGHQYLVEDADNSYCVHGNEADGSDECVECEDDVDYYDISNA